MIKGGDSMDSITFIHAADLHLDSPFQNVNSLDEIWRTRLQESGWQAFGQLISLAIERQVDFVVLSGDIFDQDSYSIKAHMRFYRQLQRLSQAAIHTYILHGNHDPQKSDSRNIFAVNDPYVHVFSADCVERFSHYKNGQEIARLYGRSFWQRHVHEDLAAQYISYEEQERAASQAEYAVKGHAVQGYAPKKIAVLHGVVGKEAEHVPYAPTSTEQIKGSNFDYWAMGHVHTRKVLSSDQPLIVYPGNTQGRNIRETGAKGCYIVTLGNQGAGNWETNLNFYPLEQVRWEQITVDIEEIDPIKLEKIGLPLLIDFVREQLEQQYTQIGKPMIVKLLLQGQTPLYRELRKADTLDVIREELESQMIAIVEIVNYTRPLLDMERLRNQKTLLGEFLTLLQQVRQNPELEQELREQLQPLYGNRQFQQHTHTKAGQLGKTPWMQAESEHYLSEWLDEVEQLGIDILLEGETF